MSRVACKKFTVSRDSVVSRLAAPVAHWKKVPTDRGKLSDKESGFESSPNSPRAESALELAQQRAPGPQELVLRGAEEGPISLDSFEFIKKLGSGGYGSVMLVQKKGGRDHKALYALKISSLNRAALVERDILPRLENVPYTLDLAYAFFDPQLNKAYLVLPFAVGKDLFALAGPCTNTKRKPGYLRRMFHHNYIKYLHRVRIILAELSVAIGHLHKLNIVYRDLKMENILVFGDGHIRLADFGLSKLFEEGESTQISGKTGTPDYMAPEVLQSSGTFTTTTTYSFEADIWGLGVIAYELIVGQLPFRGQEMAELESAILGGVVEVPNLFLKDKHDRLARKERPLLLAALSFVKALLQLKPHSRLSNNEIPKHIFFRDLDFPQIASGNHDDPPFDIRKIHAEHYGDGEIEQIPPTFAGLPSFSKKKSPDKSSFDSAAKFANYHYVRHRSGWYFSDLEGSQCEDNMVDLPDSAGYEQKAEMEISAAEQSYVSIENVPGLLEYEAILAEEHSIDSDDLVLVVREHGILVTANADNAAVAAGKADRSQRNGDDEVDNAVIREDHHSDAPELEREQEDDEVEEGGEEGEKGDYELISSSPGSPDSAMDVTAAEAGVESAASPIATATPFKDELELFPRLRVVRGCCASPPSHLPAQPTPHTMSKLKPVSNSKQRLNLGLDSSTEEHARLPVAPPLEPTRSRKLVPRRRRQELPATSTSQAGVAKTWALPSPASQFCTSLRIGGDFPVSFSQSRVPAPTASEAIHPSNASELPSHLPDSSVPLDTLLTRSGPARTLLVQSACSDDSTAMLCDRPASLAASGKWCGASPVPGGSGPSRPRRRRATAAFAAVPSPSLPPKKRRRFRSPPSMRSLSQLGRDGQRVIVQASDAAPAQSFYSLRSGVSRTPGRR